MTFYAVMCRCLKKRLKRIVKIVLPPDIDFSTSASNLAFLRNGSKKKSMLYVNQPIGHLSTY